MERIGAAAAAGGKRRVLCWVVRAGTGGALDGFVWWVDWMGLCCTVRHSSRSNRFKRLY